MKFIKGHNVPDIPLEILEAQENDTLLIFAGAGVSRKAGLPLFDELVDQVFSELHENMDDLETIEYEKNHYDRVLNLLENRLYSDQKEQKFIVRKKIIELLTIDESSDLSSHQAILDLSRTSKNTVRLVTTNFDHCFLKLIDEDIHLDSAPKLPIPKRHKWGSAVHLHGIIDSDHDENGENLVVTSGDFGSAYLTERWASRFVSELFRNFQVLFLGYQLDDPVIRYITDSISAEARKGDKGFKIPYVLAGTKESEWEMTERQWHAKNVKPILFSTDNGYDSLHDTLMEWANNVNHGLRSKAKIIASSASIRPVEPYDNDDSVNQTLDLLTPMKLENADKDNAYPSKVFAELDPPPPIEWLPALEKKGLLSLSSDDNQCIVVGSSQDDLHAIRPHQITINLWSWISKHLSEENLILWVINKGCVLHPILKRMICFELESVRKPEGQYLTFWRIVTAHNLLCETDNFGDDYQFVKSLEAEIDEIGLSTLARLFEPKIKFEKAHHWPGEDLPDTETKKIYSMNVSIQLKPHTFEQLETNKNYPNDFISLLGKVSNSLHEAMRLWHFIRQYDSDLTYIDMPSISKDAQNRRFNSYVILIELCRDLWEAAWESNQLLAESTLNNWKTLEYPIFNRLIFHAYTYSKDRYYKDGLSLLFDNKTVLLWESYCQNEVLKFVKEIKGLIDKKELDQLIDVIVSGPEREWYRSDMEDDDWHDYKDHQILITLSKLLNFDYVLNEEGQEVLTELSLKYPEYDIKKAGLDETGFHVRSYTGYDCDMSLDELFALDMEERVEKLTEKIHYNKGRVELFRRGAEQYVEKILETLKYLAKNNNYTGSIWHAGLVALADAGTKYWSELAPILTNAPHELFENESWAISRWTSEAAKELAADSEDELLYWPLFNAIVERAKQSDKESDRDVINQAINDPYGILTESLFHRFGARKIDESDGIPKGNLSECLNVLVKGEGASFSLARALVASRLNYLYYIDPDYTNESVIPLFDINTNKEASYLWHGYLWSPRITIELASSLHDVFLNVLTNPSEIGERDNNLYELFLFVCLEYPDVFEEKAQINILKACDTKAKAIIARFIWQTVDEESPDKQKDYWLNKIKPYINNIWPVSSREITEETSSYFALLCLKLVTAFEDAVATLEPKMGPIKDCSMFIRKLEKSNLAQTQPCIAFKLLSIVFSDEMRYVPREYRALLNVMKDSCEDIENRPEYRKIDDFLVRLE